MMKAYIVCTEFKGVFFGYTDNISGDTINLRDARCAIYWGTTKGVMQLAETGPTEDSKISAKANLPEVRKVCLVIEVSPEAETKWLEVV